MSYPHHTHLAPLWKRSLAAWVDFLPWLIFFVVQARRRDSRKAPELVARLSNVVYEVAAPTMFGRTVGQRVFNIRVVSQETGRSPALKQSLVSLAVVRVPGLVLEAFWWLESRQPSEQMKALKVEVEQLEQKHRGDPKERCRAICALYEERNVKMVRPFLVLLLRLALSLAYGRTLTVSRRRDPLNQGIPDAEQRSW